MQFSLKTNMHFDGVYPYLPIISLNKEANLEKRKTTLLKQTTLIALKQWNTYICIGKMLINTLIKIGNCLM